MERFETKYDLLNQAYKDDRLKRSTKAVMQYLVALSDKTKSHPSVATIARAIGMSDRTVQRHMRLLELYGYLERKSRYYHNEQLTNEYVFNLSVLEADSDRREQVEGVMHQISSTDLNEKKEEKPYRKKTYLNWIYQQSDLQPAERVLLVYLVHKADRHGRSYGSIATICKRLRISKRQFCRVLQVIHDKKLVRIQKHGREVVIQLRPIPAEAPAGKERAERERKDNDNILKNENVDKSIQEVVKLTQIQKAKNRKNPVLFLREIIDAIWKRVYHMLS